MFSYLYVVLWYCLLVMQFMLMLCFCVAVWRKCSDLGREDGEVFENSAGALGPRLCCESLFVSRRGHWDVLTMYSCTISWSYRQECIPCYDVAVCILKSQYIYSHTHPFAQCVVTSKRLTTPGIVATRHVDRRSCEKKWKCISIALDYIHINIYNNYYINVGHNDVRWHQRGAFEYR
jgi:hypothetical protein